jgi:hypothetical protein
MPIVVGIIILLFQAWLVLAGVSLALVLPVVVLIVLVKGIGEAVSEVIPQRYRPYDDHAAAPAALKPQRIVFWWLPHEVA